MRVEDARRRAREDVANHAAERAGEDAARDGDQRVSAAVEHALARCGGVGGDAWKETIGERGAILDDVADRVVGTLGKEEKRKRGGRDGLARAPGP